MELQVKAKKGVPLILADFFGLLVGLLNGFFLPTVFSIEGYAVFREFTLYATFTVFFSFGWCDGLYLLYGGKDAQLVNKSIIKSYYIFLIKLQSLTFIFLFILSIFINNLSFRFFVIFVFPVQLVNFFRLFYRATGEFSKYSIVQGSLVALELLSSLLIICFFRSNQPDLFLTLKIISHFIIAGVLSFLFFRELKCVETVKLAMDDYLNVLKPGIVVLLADLLAALIFSIDRWVVKAFFNTESFAYYAFAISILNLFIILITSITNIFYSFISKKSEDAKYLTILKKSVVLVSSFLPVSYFILKFVIIQYLPVYKQALDILGILMLTLPYISVINIIYINTYKAGNRVKLYTKRMLVILPLFVILNILVAFTFRDLRAVAVAILVGFILWYLYSSRDFTAIKITKADSAYLMLTQICFIFIYFASLNWLLSIFLYVLLLIIVMIIFYFREATDLFALLRRRDKEGGH